VSGAVSGCALCRAWVVRYVCQTGPLPMGYITSRRAVTSSGRTTRFQPPPLRPSLPFPHEPSQSVSACMSQLASIRNAATCCPPPPPFPPLPVARACALPQRTMKVCATLYGR
jgi:hypothetical protein